MSIRDRINEAQFLFLNGHKNGALLPLLVAVAATARLRHPQPVSDGKAFRTFLDEETPVVTRGGAQTINVVLNDKQQSISDILYKYLRNQLVHEAKSSKEVVFMPTPAGSLFTIKNTGARIELSESFLDGLANAVVYAPENRVAFPDIARMPEEVLRWQMFDERWQSEGVMEYWKQRIERVIKLNAAAQASGSDVAAD